MRVPIAAAAAALLAWCVPIGAEAPPSVLPVSGPETLHYGIEWRFVRAGVAKLDWRRAVPAGSGWHADVSLESAGMVAKLYNVREHYTALLREPLCAARLTLESREGKRQRDTRVTFDAERGKADYIERDVVKGNVVLQKTIEVPACIPDVLGALYKLRTVELKPGQTLVLPMSDGKRAVNARVDVQERERVTTPAGTFQTIRCEVHMLNDVLFPRKGRVFVWITDDARRLPVQIRMRFQLLVGTVTLQLEKEERS